MEIDLTQPPEVVNCGASTHGVRGPVDIFQLPDLWAFHCYDYTADLVLDGDQHLIRPGTVTLLPPGTLTEYRYRGPSHHNYAHLRVPPDAHLRVSTSPTAGTAAVPAVVPPSPRTVTIGEHLATAVSYVSTAPERTRAELWLALLLTVEASAERPNSPDHVARALGWIESHLAEPISVPQIAAAVGLSQTHLTRLVRAHTGRTVVGHLRHRRVERAHHLLRHSTMTVAAVAATVGYADLQSFNKACRVETGRSPRALRSERPES